MPTRQGSIHLFRLCGIDVYLHYAWFLAVAYFVSQTQGYSSVIWSIGECLAMFLIVLAHEFGHAFACQHGHLPRSHVVNTSLLDVGFLRVCEGTLFENLVVPEEIGVQRSSAVGGNIGRNPVIILGITLRFLQSLLTTGRATVKI